MKFDFVMSADSHLLEPHDLWKKPLNAKWGDRVPQIVQAPPGLREGRWFFTGAEYIILETLVDAASGDAASVERAGYDPDHRVKLLEIDGVNAEVLNPTWMLYVMRTSDPEIRRACAAVYNDWVAEFVHGRTDRFVGIGMVPPDNVEWACRELERGVAKGLKGVMIFADTPPGTPPYRDPCYDRFWATAQDLKIPVTLHIITGNVRDLFTMHGDERFNIPRETILLFQEACPVLANEFIFGGIFDRFPDLKVTLGEFEVSWLPYYCWRLDQLQNDFAPIFDLPKLREKASNYMRRRVYHGMIDDPHCDIVFEKFGADLRLMWGSDFPHPRCTYPKTHEILTRVLGRLPEERQRRIAGLTAAELYGIPVPTRK